MFKERQWKRESTGEAQRKESRKAEEKWKCEWFHFMPLDIVEKQILQRQTSIVTGVFVVKYTLKNILHFHSVCALEFLPRGMTLNSSLGAIILYCMAIWALGLPFDWNKKNASILESESLNSLTDTFFKMLRNSHNSCFLVTNYIGHTH